MSRPTTSGPASIRSAFSPAANRSWREHPEAFIRTAGGIFANGRDPYFPAWPDVVQLNAYSPALREAVADTLIEVAGQCDGLRCDMAMLMTNEVFGRTWGDRAGPVPAEDYWPTLIARVKQAQPNLLFMAEAYWDMEWTLQQQGFDLCYDKRLYDRLLHESPTRCAGICRPIRPIRSGLSGSSRITTSRAPRPCSPLGKPGRLPSSCRPSRVPGSTTTVSSRAAARTCRCS